MATSRVTAAMERAIKLVEAGKNSYEAAKEAGVTSSGLRRTPQYQSLLVAGKVNIGKPGRKNRKQ